MINTVTALKNANKGLEPKIISTINTASEIRLNNLKNITNTSVLMIY